MCESLIRHSGDEKTSAYLIIGRTEYSVINSASALYHGHSGRLAAHFVTE